MCKNCENYIMQESELCKYCYDCNKDLLLYIKDYYMIRFDLWDKFGVGEHQLCMDCMEIRL